MAHNAAIAALEASQKVLVLQEEDLLMEALAAVAAVSSVCKLTDFIASRERDSDNGVGAGGSSGGTGGPLGDATSSRASSAQGQRFSSGKWLVAVPPSLLHFATVTLEFRGHLHLRRGSPFWNVAAADLRDISRLIGPLIARAIRSGSGGAGGSSTGNSVAGVAPPAQSRSSHFDLQAASGSTDSLFGDVTGDGLSRSGSAATSGSASGTGAAASAARVKPRGILTTLSFWGVAVGSVDTGPEMTSSGYRRVFASAVPGVVGGLKQAFVRAWAILGLLELAHFGDHHNAVDSFRCVPWRCWRRGSHAFTDPPSTQLPPPRRATHP